MYFVVNCFLEITDDFIKTPDNNAVLESFTSIFLDFIVDSLHIAQILSIVITVKIKS